MCFGHESRKHAVQAIKAGDADFIVAGGMENMSMRRIISTGETDKNSAISNSKTAWC